MPAPHPDRTPLGSHDARWRQHLERWWPWLAGTLVGLLVLGPGLGPGSLLSLDLLVTPHIPVPNGLYGLGPALSQRVPSFTVLGLASVVVGGPVAAKAAIVAMVAAAFAGASRLVGHRAPVASQAAAGLLWAAGPFALTRIGVGHLNVVWALAALPWALPRLCRPSEAPWSTYLAALLLAFGGPGSGTLGVALAAVGLVMEPRPRRPVAVIGAVAAANLLWVAPTSVLLWAGAEVSGAGGFATHPGDALGWPGLLVGGGFWRHDMQVGAVGGWGALGGILVLALALVGWRQLDRRWARPATVAAAIGLLLAAATAVPGVRVPYRWVTDLPVGAPLRESQRFLALWLVVAAPAAALGGLDLARRVRARSVAWASVAAVVPLAVAAAVAVPGWWGVGGRLDPVEFPAGWAAARARIHEARGTVVAFPWSEYPPLEFADGRQAFNPIPDYLGGDVVSSYDPVFDPSAPHQEQVDRRARVVDDLVAQLRKGQPVGDGLADLGVRWVFLAHEREWEAYDRVLSTDPGLRMVHATPDADLYRVAGWRGPVTDPSGERHELDRPIPFLIRTDAPAGSVLDVAGAPGWVQGFGTPVQVTDDGRLRITRSAGWLWFWPAPVLLLIDGALAAAAVVALRHRARDRSIAPPAEILAASPPDG